MSVESALNTYSEKQLKKDKGPQRRNKKPEKDVEKDCLKWMRDSGFDVNIIEAGGGRNAYGATTVSPGFADCAGNDKDGYAVYVEFKAPSRRSSLREHQRRFLRRKIRTNAFSICVDSCSLLSVSYRIWRGLIDDGRHQRARDYLMTMMPKQNIDSWDPLF